jgi:hypothetical protein
VQVLVDEESNWLGHTRVTSEGYCQNQTDVEGESSFWGKMVMKLKEGNLCSTLGSSFMATSIIFLVNSFVM